MINIYSIKNWYTTINKTRYWQNYVAEKGRRWFCFWTHNSNQTFAPNRRDMRRLSWVLWKIWSRLDFISCLRVLNNNKIIALKLVMLVVLIVRQRARLPGYSQGGRQPKVGQGGRQPKVGGSLKWAKAGEHQGAISPAHTKLLGVRWRSKCHWRLAKGASVCAKGAHFSARH